MHKVRRVISHEYAPEWTAGLSRNLSDFGG
jgi:hypothetical protein